MACGHRKAETPALSSASLTGEYDVAYEAGILRVDARFDRVGAELFAVDRGAEPFLDELEVAGRDGRFHGAKRNGSAFVLAPCASGPCRFRYRYRLRDACRAIDEVDVASEEGDVLEAPPSTWLLAPVGSDPAARIRFRVTTRGPDRFVTGVFRARDSDRGGAWDITLDDLWTSPYSAFGPLRVHDVPTANAKIALAIVPGKMAASDATLVAWTRAAARAVGGYYERFPMPEALVIAVPSRGRWVGFGKALGGGGGSILVRVGEKATERAFQSDWVLVHEMIHLGFPSVAREHDWAEEGLATYVEPFARARAGILSPAEAWEGLVDGLPNGLPAAGDRGLDQTPTWGRTYWGGALFYLLAELEIRKKSENKLGLEHALRGIVGAGGTNAHRWNLDDAFAAGDKATGLTVLRDLHAAMATSPHPVDLEALWRELGIVRKSGKIEFDDSAPLAAIRRAMTNRNGRED